MPLLAPPFVPFFARPGYRYGPKHYENERAFCDRAGCTRFTRIATMRGIFCGDKCADFTLRLYLGEVPPAHEELNGGATFQLGVLNMAAKKKAAKKEATETQETATAEAAPAQPSANGVTRPKPGTATGRVWEIADELSEQAGQPAARADVLKAYEGEGGNASTGATQYGRWRKFHNLGRYAKTEAAAGDTAEVEA